MHALLFCVLMTLLFVSLDALLRYDVA
jgi:hypothetical protein